MKRTWTRSEKWLFATPLLIVVLAFAITIVPRSINKVAGWPERLNLAPGTQIRSMALSRNGQILAAAGSIIGKDGGWLRGSGTIHLWDARTAKPLATIAPVYAPDARGFIRGFDIYALALSPSAKHIGFTRTTNWTLYDVTAQMPLWKFPQFISHAEFSPDGHFIALITDGETFVVDAKNGKVRAQWKAGDDGDWSDVSWSPDGKWVTSNDDHKSKQPVEIHQAASGRLVRRLASTQKIKTGFRGSRESIVSVNFSPDGQKIVTTSSVGIYSSEDNFDDFAPIRCYNPENGKLLWQAKTPVFEDGEGHRPAFCDAIFSPDGNTVAAYQQHAGRVFLLDATTGNIKKTLRLKKDTSTNVYVPPGLAFSPDGKRLFVRGRDAVLFWDFE